MRLISRLMTSSAKKIQYLRNASILFMILMLFLVSFALIESPKVSAQLDCQKSGTINNNGESVSINENDEECLDTGASGGACGGSPHKEVKTMIDLGCRGKGNPIMDFTFAIVRVLSIGVGVVVVGSLMFAGIQYTTSAGDPNSVAKAIERIKTTTIALVVYIFAYALLNWIIPGALFK